jgi:hypothetical protein
VSIVLTAIAAAVLALIILPRQNTILAGLDPDNSPANAVTTQHATARLAMHTGMFNLTWVAITVLMILRPGATGE